MKSIRARLGLLFILFFLLIAVSVGATYWGLQVQALDALLINLAGRQRMLVQQMTRLAVEIQANPGSRSALLESIEAFEESLHAFQTGGRVRYPAGTWVVVPPAGEPEIQEQLQRVERVWETYRMQLYSLLASFDAGEETRSTLAELRQLSSELVSEADQVVRQFQDASRMRIQRLRTLQAGFFAAALILLGAGSRLVHGSILTPLRRLERSADRIRHGDLNTPVESGGAAEINFLAHTLDRMRFELEASHQELARWNQTLEEKVKGRTQELDALYKVSQEISARLDRREVLNSITRKASQLLQAEVALLCLLDARMGTLGLQAVSGSDESIRQLSSPVDNPYIQLILTEPGRQHCKAGGCYGTCGILDDRYRTSHLAAPLVVENRVIGALCVGDRQAGAFSEEAPALLNRLASAAAVAIENARLYEQAELLAALEERQRIAAAMHDGVAQMLYALGLQLDQVDDQLQTQAMEQAGHLLDRARKNLVEVSNEVRRSIANLQEAPAKSKTLSEQLRESIQKHAHEAGRKIDWQIEVDDSLTLPHEDARQVLSIAQEALANARRHSAASHISVQLLRRDGEAILTIADNGRGFDPSKPFKDGRQHFGLKILQARAAQINGHIVVDSAPGRGTCISLTWPIQPDDVPLIPAESALQTQEETG